MTPERKHYDARVTIRVPDKAKRSLHHRAIDAGLTLNDYIVHILLRWIETDEKGQ